MDKEEILIDKLCNALIPDAEVSPGVAVFGGVEGSMLGSAVDSTLASFRKKHGGLWVGGRIYVTTASVTFSVNAMNKAFHSPIPDVRIPLAEITEVTHEPAIFMDTITVKGGGKELKFKCYGAKKVLARIKELSGKA
ncbi:MAG TPA: hypothetical protein DDW67_05025 [Elusimicrobia bacterium]|jgi:hypothetical protein|nr:hypothetical protein [Elusimicrobiota bacterium]